MKPISSQDSQNGLTLIETLITVAIVALLIGLTAPSFQQIITRWQVLQAAQAMESTLQLARSEAIRYGGNIVLHKASNAASKSSGCQNASTKEEWGCGWFLFQDLNNSGTWTSTEPKIQEVQLNGELNIIHSSGGASIKFNRYGIASGINAKGIKFSPAKDGISSSSTRTLCMATGGRIRIIEDSSCTS